MTTDTLEIHGLSAVKYEEGYMVGRFHGYADPDLGDVNGALTDGHGVGWTAGATIEEALTRWLKLLEGGAL